ncbi:hypothetical protein [Epilithonimonas sp.]|uniref:hypothetical protein n=1 Tax=Epilithonimonas sp. TaxID=2894511 RepID=UPI0028A67738|nr:hypothetical protein [Epilithonimonas sp.]
MELTQIKLLENKIIKYISENLSLLLIIPAIPGGIRQLILISILSPSLLIYFSTTQVLLDGVSILFQLIIVLFTVYFFNKFINKYRSHPIKILLGMSILIVGFIFYMKQQYNSFAISNFDILMKICFSVLAIMFAQYIIKFLKPSALPMAFFSIFAVFAVIFLTYSQPVNVLNISNDNQILVFKKKYPNIQLEYVNDIYLIYNLNSKEKDKRKQVFFIQKHENLFAK